MSTPSSMLLNIYNSEINVDSTTPILDSTNTTTFRRILSGTRSYYLISASNDTTVKLWLLNNGTLITTFTGHTKAVTCVLNVGNGFIASGSADNTVRIWFTVNSRLLYVFNSTNGGHSDVVSSLAWISTSLIASASWDNTVKIWDLSKYVLKFTFNSTNGGHTNKVNCLSYLKNGLLASGSSDYLVKLWDPINGNLTFTFDMFNGGYMKSIIQLLSFSKDILVANGNMAILKVWSLNLTGNVFMYSFDSSINGTFGLFSALTATDNSYLVTGLNYGGIKVWDLSLGVANYTIDGTNSYNSYINLLCAIPGGLFAAANGLNEIRVFDTYDGSLVFLLTGHTNTITSMILAYNGNLISGSLDNTIRVWSLRTGSLLYSFNSTNGGGHSGSINAFDII